jgi:hypothetical protein
LAVHLGLGHLGGRTADGILGEGLENAKEEYEGKNIFYVYHLKIKYLGKKKQAPAIYGNVNFRYGNKRKKEKISVLKN